MPAISTTRRSCISPQRPRTLDDFSAPTRFVAASRSRSCVSEIACICCRRAPYAVPRSRSIARICSSTFSSDARTGATMPSISFSWLFSRACCSAIVWLRARCSSRASASVSARASSAARWLSAWRRAASRPLARASDWRACAASVSARASAALARARPSRSAASASTRPRAAASTHASPPAPAAPITKSHARDGQPGRLHEARYYPPVQVTARNSIDRRAKRDRVGPGA